MKTIIEMHHGNCVEYINSMGDLCFDAIITDPPYDMTDLKLHDFQRICGGNIIMFCAQENPFFKPDEFAYWIKQPSTKNYSKHIGRFVELILIKRQGNTFNTGLHWSNYTGVYDDRLLEAQCHPFEKPISLMRRLISIYTKPGDVILDPFCGSGTTLIAASQLGRRAIGIESNLAYFATAQRRIREQINEYDGQ